MAVHELITKEEIMRITFVALGTRGDVQPVIAVCKALQKLDKYEINVLTSKNFADMVESHGLNSISISTDMQALMNSELGKEWTAKGVNQMKQAQLMRKLLRTYGWEMVSEAWQGIKDKSDVMVSGFTSDGYIQAMAEKLGIQQLRLQLQPLEPSKAGSSSVATLFPDHTNILNYWYGLFGARMVWGMFEPETNRLRTEVLGLPKQKANRYLANITSTLTLLAFSEHVVPPAPEWGDNYQMTGFLFLDDNQSWTPPDDLAAFLSSGEKPVYIGFGSMPTSNPEHITQMILDALKISGDRAVLLSGWAGIGNVDLPDTVHVVDNVPHNWLFPRMKAVVHHGGAGTLAAGLRAGVPSVIIPHMADQPFWGRRVAALGVGPKAINHPDLNAERLGQALKQTHSPEMQRKAQELGEKIRAEDGVARAVELIEKWVS